MGHTHRKNFHFYCQNYQIMNTWSKSPELKWKSLLLNHLQLRIRTADAHLVALEEWGEGRKNQCQYSLFRHFKKKKFPKFFQQLYYLWKLLGLWAASVVLRRLWCCAQRGLSGSRGFPGRRLFGGQNLRTLRFVGSGTWGIRKVQATPLWDEMGLQWRLLLKGLYLGFLTKQTKMQLWRFAARAAFFLAKLQSIVVAFFAHCMAASSIITVSSDFWLLPEKAAF